MAELPKYQETGRIYSDLPSLDFANVRENIKLTQNINNSLDRLADFSTKIAAKETARKAEEFAVTNPITLDDLKNAEKSGVTANDLVKATGGGAIWQETLRKFQAEQLRTQLEVSANTSALDIANQVKMRQLTDPNEITAKFEALQNGMSKPLKSLDPEAAIKFQASSGALIKNLHKLSLDKLYDDYVLDKKVETGNYVNVALESVDALFKAEKNPEAVKSRLMLVRKTLSGLAAEGGADFAYTTITQFDKDVQEKTVNHFINISTKDDFAKNPQTGKRDENLAMIRMINGDFGEDTPLFKTLDPKEQAQIRASYRTRENDRIATEKQVAEEQTLKDVGDVNNLKQDYINGGRRDNSIITKLEEIVRRNPKALDSDALERFKKGDQEDEAKAEFSSAAITLKERIRANPNMSWTDITIQGKQLGLGQGIINRYIYPFYTSSSDRDFYNKLRYGSKTPAGSIPGYIENQTLLNDTNAVNDYISNIVERNKKLPPGQKKEIVPTKSEALDIIRNKQVPVVADIAKVVKESNVYLTGRKIKNIIINENSSMQDSALVSQIERKNASGQYILSQEVRNYLTAQLRIIDSARANK
jgi:hypothetical protein